MNQLPNGPPQAAQQARSLIGVPSSIQGITAVDRTLNRAPVIMVSGREREGKSSLSTSLFGYPTPMHQPLILAIDPTGPDSCINLGFAVHAVRIDTMPGAKWIDRARAMVQVVEQNIQQVRQQYGSIVIDDASTLSYRMLEEARRTTKNPDPRSHYQQMYTWFNEIWWRVADLAMPTVWLAWVGEPSFQEDKAPELAPPDIAGKRFARSIVGRTQHMFILERRFVGIGGQNADPKGYARVLHTTPWNGQNAGGRLQHLFPDVIPADLAQVFRAAIVSAP